MMQYERIKQLAEQASEGTRGKYEWREKFAELIVRECMDVASPSYMNTPEQGVYYVEQAIDRIAEHFGVTQWSSSQTLS